MPNKLIFPNPLAFYPFMHVIALWVTWCPRVSIALKNCFLYLQATPKDRENRLCTMNKVSKFKFFVWLAVATEASIEAKNVLDEKLALRGIFVARICVNASGNLIQSSSPPLNNFMWFWTYWFVWDFSLCSFLGLFFPHESSFHCVFLFMLMHAVKVLQHYVNIFFVYHNVIQALKWKST